MKAATWTLVEEDGSLTLHAEGDWTALTLDQASRQPLPAVGGQQANRIDVSALGRIDTTGALLLLKLMPTDGEILFGTRDDVRRLANLVAPGMTPHEDSPPPRGYLTGFFARFGQQIIEIAHDAYAMLVFTGQMILALGGTLLRPRRLRVTPLFAVMQESGINALPIVFIMTFFIGAIIALVGTNLLTSLGVEIFTVELVGVAILREFGVVIAAILLAGRSASAFAAQIGSKRMNQEVAAMQVMGVDRFDALVTPRILAALVMIPLMTFVGDLGGLLGGLLVSWATIDISPSFFVTRLAETVSIKHFWIGMGKAPFLALLIAAAGCRHGMMVGGDVQSLGRHVTSAVVQSVFLIIMFDAIFAVIFMVLGL